MLDDARTHTKPNSRPSAEPFRQKYLSLEIKTHHLPVALELATVIVGSAALLLRPGRLQHHRCHEGGSRNGGQLHVEKDNAALLSQVKLCYEPPRSQTNAHVFACAVELPGSSQQTTSVQGQKKEMAGTRGARGGAFGARIGASRGARLQ